MKKPLFLFCVLCLLAGCSGLAARPMPAVLRPADILVIAPHPDDETLGCAGIIQQALAHGKQVQVVILTNGDGNKLAAAMLAQKEVASLTTQDMLALAHARQVEALAAAAIQGLPTERVVFLGYPDSGLAQVYRTDTAPYTSANTQQSATYGSFRQDYHTLAHGQAAPYLKSALIGDVMEILQLVHPAQVYVTSDNEMQPDHRTAYALVGEAIRSGAYSGAVSAYLIHTALPTDWPQPQGATPQQPFTPPNIAEGQLLVAGQTWQAAQHIPLTSAQVEAKLDAIHRYASQMTSKAESLYLESFVKNEEVFWPVDVQALALSTPPATSAPAPGGFPVGVYQANIQSDDLSTWELSLNGDGTYLAILSVQNVASVSAVVGVFTVQGDQIVMSDDSPQCRGKGEGSYVWRVTDHGLQLSPINDDCAARAALLSSQWVKR